MAPELKTSPPETPSYLLSYPVPHVLLVTINRAHAMNSIPMEAHWEGHALFTWFDHEPSLRVAIITGAGPKAFCAGQDLVQQSKWKQSPPPKPMMLLPPTGFLGLSRRRGKKCVIAAVNGFALGGGFETCLNCDMVVASPAASFGLPETAVGVYAAAGGLPRLPRICGLQIASEIAMTGRRLSAEEALRYLLINKISATPESAVAEAVEMATRIADQNPDAIIVTRSGLREAWETASVARGEARTAETYAEAFSRSMNMKIGVDAFANKQKPKWVDSKL